MLDHLVARAAKTTAILPVSEKALGNWSKALAPALQAWIKAAGFKAKPGSFLLLPDEAGRAGRFLAGVEEGIDLWSLASLPGALPTGPYHLEEDELSPAHCLHRTARDFPGALP